MRDRSLVKEPAAMGVLQQLKEFFVVDNARVVGCWHVVRVEGPDTPDDVELDFRPDGQLISATKRGDRWDVVRLTYRMKRSVIVSSGGVRTGYRFEEDGTLRLDADDSCTWYEKGPKRAPEPE